MSNFVMSIKDSENNQITAVAYLYVDQADLYRGSPG